MMKKTIVFTAFVLAFLVIIWGIMLPNEVSRATPQNNAISEAQRDNLVYDATNGAIQGIVVGRGVTSPESNNLSSAQIANLSYDATNGAIQLILSSNSSDIPFINTTSLTDGDLLKYDDTGAEWINTEGEIGIDDNNLLMLNSGTKTAPSLYFTGDPNTGIFPPAADSFGITSAGTEILRLDDNGTSFFQTGTDSTTAFQFLDADGGTPILNIDATNERVGIGTASPLFKLHLEGSNPDLLIKGTGTFSQFRLQDTVNNFTIGHDSSGTFFIYDDGVGYRFTIDDASGNVGIGTNLTNPLAKLHVAGSALFQNTSDTTTAFQILDADGGTPILNVDSTNERVGIGTAAAVGTFEVGGSQGDNVTVVSAASANIALTDRMIMVSYTDTGTVALTLPAASSAWNSTDAIGLRYFIKDLDCNASGNNITISRAGSDTITTTTEGNTSVVISTDGGGIWIMAVSASEWAVF